MDEQIKAFHAEVRAHKLVAHCPNITKLVDYGLVDLKGHKKGALVFKRLAQKLSEREAPQLTKQAQSN